MPDERFIRREMARKARRIARELEDIAEVVRDQARLLDSSVPDASAVVDTLVRVVDTLVGVDTPVRVDVHDVPRADERLRLITRELASLAAIRVDVRGDR
jgi:hypothetical protein